MKKVLKVIKLPFNTCNFSVEEREIESENEDMYIMRPDYDIKCGSFGKTPIVNKDMLDKVHNKSSYLGAMTVSEDLTHIKLAMVLDATEKVDKQVFLATQQLERYKEKVSSLDSMRNELVRGNDHE